MIKRVPGFTFDAGADARGFAGTSGNVLIDGQRPTSKSDSLDSILQRIPASEVERIDLIRGGTPGIDMQGRTVVVNIVRKTTDSTSIIATAQDVIFFDGHQVPTASLEFTRHVDGKIYEGSVGLIQNWDDSIGIGRHEIYTPAGVLVSRDTTKSTGMGIGGSAKGAVTLPMWGGEFKVNANGSMSPWRDSLTYDRPGVHQLFVDNDHNVGSELGVHWKGPVGPFDLEVLGLQRLGWERSVSTSNDGVSLQDFRSTNHTGESIARATLRYSPLPDLNVEAGAEGAYNFLGGTSTFAINGANIPLPSADVHVNEKRGEVFAQGTWRYSPEWLVEAGVRFEFSTISQTGTTNLTRSFTYPKPRAVVTWSPLPDTQVRFRYEKVLGQLDFNNFAAAADLAATGITAGNANLRPDQHDQLELSFEQHFWTKGAFVLSLLHEEITDVVDVVAVTTPAGTFAAPGNIGSGRNNKLAVTLTLPLDKLGIDNGLLRATTSWQYSRVIDPIQGFPRIISRQRPQSVNLNFSQDLPEWNSTWGVFYFNGWDEYSYRLTQIRHRAVIPPFTGFFWDWKPDANWSLHFEMDNLLRYVYNDVRTIYAGPRNANPVSSIEIFNSRSQPTIQFQIRRTFN